MSRLRHREEGRRPDEANSRPEMCTLDGPRLPRRFAPRDDARGETDGEGRIVTRIYIQENGDLLVTDLWEEVRALCDG